MEQAVSEKQSPFATEPIGRLIVKFAVPSVIALLVNSLYNIVDQIFIGWGVGYLGNGATNIVFPITIIALALALMIGDGCAAFLSICQGKQDAESAHRSVGNAVVLMILVSILLVAVFYGGRDTILAVFGATEANVDYVREYFNIIVIGIPFFVFTNGMNSIIRADGNPKFAMISTVVGCIINLILDPVAIFLLHWGVGGAALATIVGQIVSAALVVYYLFHTKSFRLQKGSFRLHGALLGRVLPLGISSLLTQLSIVVIMGVMNNTLIKYGAQSEFGADIPMTVVGIVMKFFQIVISIVVGMAAGCIPIVGFNMGAGKRDRVRALFTKLLIAEAAVGIVALVLECFPRNLISLFGAANESRYYTEFAVLAFRTYLCMLPLACVNKACFIFLQAMGKAAASTALSMIREVVFGVGFALLLPVFFGLTGVLYSMPVSDALTFLAAVFLIARTYRQLRSDPAPA